VGCTLGGRGAPPPPCPGEYGLPLRRDQAYQAYLVANPGGNFVKFQSLSTAGRLSYGDPAVPARPGGPPEKDRSIEKTVDLSEPGRSLKELQRKLAWAVGSVYGVPYVNYDTWPADYARRASERLLAIHGDP